MYFPNKKVTSEGYQFYLLKPTDLFKGEPKIQEKKELYHYKIGSDILVNFGFIVDEPQLKLKYFY
jgi:hypothetical protein